MPDLALQPDFRAVTNMIRNSRQEALRSVNRYLIELYWNIGEYISLRVEREKWGESVVSKLAQFIAETEPGSKGFSDKNLWRMRQFYEAYRDNAKLSPLVREIG